MALKNSPKPGISANSRSPLPIASSDRIRTAVNVLSDGYVSGIVAHLSKDELAKYDAEHGGRHPELQPPVPMDSQG